MSNAEQCNFCGMLIFDNDLTCPDCGGDDIRLIEDEYGVDEPIMVE